MDTDNFAEFSEPTLEVILIDVLPISFYIDLWIANPRRHQLNELLFKTNQIPIDVSILIQTTLKIDQRSFRYDTESKGHC